MTHDVPLVSECSGLLQVTEQRAAAVVAKPQLLSRKSATRPHLAPSVWMPVLDGFIHVVFNRLVHVPTAEKPCIYRRLTKKTNFNSAASDCAS